jgi:ribosomal protein S18 acetylase RimI-like enzyme
MRSWISMFETRFAPTSGIADDSSMQDLLADVGHSQMMGAERGKLKPDGISRLKNEHGATRYVFTKDGMAVAALQIVSRDGVVGRIANVYTLPEARRNGLARRLLNVARRDYDTILHSDDLTQDGAAWASSVDPE